MILLETARTSWPQPWSSHHPLHLIILLSFCIPTFHPLDSSSIPSNDHEESPDHSSCSGEIGTVSLFCCNVRDTSGPSHGDYVWRRHHIFPFFAPQLLQVGGSFEKERIFWLPTLLSQALRGLRTSTSLLHLSSGPASQEKETWKRVNSWLLDHFGSKQMLATPHPHPPPSASQNTRYRSPNKDIVV